MCSQSKAVTLLDLSGPEHHSAYVTPAVLGTPPLIQKRILNSRRCTIRNYLLGSEEPMFQ